jgi:hypothetical protein
MKMVTYTVRREVMRYALKSKYADCNVLLPCQNHVCIMLLHGCSSRLEHDWCFAAMHRNAHCKQKRAVSRAAGHSYEVTECMNNDCLQKWLKCKSTLYTVKM